MMRRIIAFYQQKVLYNLKQIAVQLVDTAAIASDLQEVQRAQTTAVPS
ncbi:MAG: hypothetical protein V7K68_28495 [Nostoc sp.]